MIDSAWLPAGWSAENYGRHADVFVIDRPQDVGGGMVSLDFSLRVWCGGYTLPRHFPGDIERSYGGRGWKEKMVKDACAWLERTMTRKPAGGPFIYSQGASGSPCSESTRPNGQDPSAPAAQERQP